MIVYITTNLVNGKKYIGKDENDVKSYMGSGIGIVNAIKKYGKKNFVKEILAECETSDQLNELEIYYINYYNAQESELFYNIAPGGTGGKVAQNYKYVEIPVVEICPNTYKIIGQYKSSKEAAVLNNLNYKSLNAVCNKQKFSVKNRIFVFKKDYNLKELIACRLPKRQKYITLSHRTGVFYYKLEDLWKAEYPEFKTFSSFLNYTFKHKNLFKDQFITERI